MAAPRNGKVWEAPPSSGLQQLLQSAVQSVRWTYSLFWQLCPQQGRGLVWGEGYYNGAIKTRKTIQPMEAAPAEDSAEEVSLHRSHQLRELYDSLSTGDAGQPARRPCASLSPEDLTESEWFYLMCVSFSFPPGTGLPGKAFAEQRHVWLTRANEADSKIFSRAILAKSAQVQTVVCIPIMDGVLELGTTENVEEDMGLIEHAKSFFTDQLDHQSKFKPALSEHSTSGPVACMEQSLFHPRPQEEDDDDGDDDDDDVEEDNDDDDDEVEASTDSDAGPGRYGAGNISTQPIHPSLTAAEAAIPAAGPSELLQLEMSESIRLGSPDDCTNNIDSESIRLAVGHTSRSQSDHQHRDDSYQASWHFLHEDLGNGIPQSSGSTQIQDPTPEDAHYSETVSAILQRNSGQWMDSSSIGHHVHATQSAFSKWNYGDRALPVLSDRTSQWLLKYVLFSVPNLHCKCKDDGSPKSRDGEGGHRFRKGMLLDELSANHVLAERRRREKLNERFIVLRSLVPLVTKMDKTSILGDTIEYLKQLRRHIQDIEAQNIQIENRRSKTTKIQRPSNSKDQTVQTKTGFPGVHHAFGTRNRVALLEKRKLRVVDGGKGAAKATRLVEVLSSNVEVSIIETDALLELQCPYRDGLLLKIMQALHALRLEIASIQSSSSNATFVAEIRAKVKEIHGKKASIVEVKKAIHQIFSQYSFYV